MYVVAGVSGHVGSVVATELLSQGLPVRVIVRSDEKGAPWRAKGAEVSVTDLGDAAALARALNGAESAFLLLPPPSPVPATFALLREWQRDLATKIGAAVKASSIPRVVFLSSIGAQRSEGNGPIAGLFYGEAALRTSGAQVTFVRAAAFMENLAMRLGPMKEQGILPSLNPVDLAMYCVATGDVGRVCAETMTDPPEDSIIEITGPAEYTARAEADTFAKYLGRGVTVAAVPEDAIPDAMAKSGMPPALADAYTEMNVGLNHGLVVFERPELVRRGATTLDQFVAQLLGS